MFWGGRFSSDDVGERQEGEGGVESRERKLFVCFVEFCLFFFCNNKDFIEC